MIQLHIFVKKTILKVVDFFYPLFKKFLPIQTFRYAACGGANMLFDICLFTISYNFIFHKQNVDLGFLTLKPEKAAVLFAFCLSFPTGFYLSRYVVFQQSNLRGRVQLIRYLFIVLLCLLLNYVFISLFVEYFGWYPTPSKIVTTVIVVIFSFISQSYFSFGNKRKMPVEESV